MTDPRADDQARLTEAVNRAVSGADTVTSHPGPKAERVPVRKPEHLATQSVYPWRTAFRAGAGALVGFEVAAAAASPLIGPFVDHYIPGAGATVVGFGVFCGALATLTNRVANLPPVTSFLTGLGIGPIPKHH